MTFLFRPSSTRTELLRARPASACGSALILFLALSAAFVFPAYPREAVRAGIVSSQPLIEVVSFGVAPIAGGQENSPRPGDVIYRSEPTVARAEREIDTRVLSGETWPALFQRIKGRLESKVDLSEAVSSRIGSLPALQPGKYVRLRAASGRDAVELDYVVGLEEAYSITLAADGIQVRPRASDPRVADKMRADPAKASLFTATDAIGLPDRIVLQLAEIFADDVDFHRELHHGYRCTLVYEVLYRDGHIDRVGRILAAQFLIRNRRLEVYYFNDGGARDGYYTETGKSMKKAFRKSPVEFSRITSEYTLARFHPVLGLWRAHRGIDYAAPTGSKVVATADGVVEFMGDRGELGNLVILRHYGRFLTYYGHLSGFAENLSVGSKVRKGDAVGLVGMTGLATGPHLHYEFRMDNGSGDRLGIPVPPPDVLEEPPLESDAFFKAVTGYRAKFEAAQRAHVVVLE